jgi:sensor histidine kinase regulating citrate/malate metabolism
MRRILFLNYFTAMVIVTIMTGLVYVNVQQTYRSNANDPQIQLANEINANLKAGRSIERLWPDSIDIQSSLGVFAALYDEHAQPLRSSALLDGKIPQLPPGVFDFAKNQGEDRITWQPRAGVRMAMVVLRGNFSPVAYIAVGRSLKEVEVREQNLMKTTAICWIGMIVLILFSSLFHFSFYKKRKQGYARYQLRS